MTQKANVWEGKVANPSYNNGKVEFHENRKNWMNMYWIGICRAMKNQSTFKYFVLFVYSFYIKKHALFSL